MLQSSGLKVGCIVNDVAAVNIDAKLIRADQTRSDPSTTTDLADTIELANGCACEWSLSWGIDAVSIISKGRSVVDLHNSTESISIDSLTLLLSSRLQHFGRAIPVLCQPG